MSKGLKIKKNIWNDPSNCCAYCNRRIRDWKLFCNQKCYDEQQVLEQIKFDEDEAFQAFYDNDCWDEGHEHDPITVEEDILERQDAIASRELNYFKNEKKRLREIAPSQKKNDKYVFSA